MANRWLNQFTKAFQKEVVHVFARVTFGASGAPTLVQGNPPLSSGILSVTRNSTGVYTFVFGTQINAVNNIDVYPYLLRISHVWDESGNSGTAPLAPALFIKANSVATAGTGSVQVVFNSAGTATDPASGEAVYLDFVMRNSNAP
jgi:hypothetical protein